VGLNSTLQPMGEFAGGGLNLIVCQFVDCMFLNNEQNELEHWIKAIKVIRKHLVLTHFEMIGIFFVIQIYFLTEQSEWITDVQMSKMFRHWFVNAWKKCKSQC
jgi:hypothetical protein